MSDQDKSAPKQKPHSHVNRLIEAPVLNCISTLSYFPKVTYIFERCLGNFQIFFKISANGALQLGVWCNTT